MTKLQEQIDDIRKDFLKMQKQHITLQKVVYEKDLEEEDNWNLTVKEFMAGVDNEVFSIKKMLEN